VPKLWKIRGGYDLLPRAMAQPLSDQIRYGAEVRRIEQEAATVRVTYLSGGMLHTETADRLICTIPFTVLRDIDVAPTSPVRDRFYGSSAQVDYPDLSTQLIERRGS
jgi:monoamine oxidase